MIFTGGPKSVYAEGAPKCDKRILELGVPVLGICYGSQLISLMLDGRVEKAPSGQYGNTEIHYDTSSVIFKDMDEDSQCWMSHTDYIGEAPPEFKVTATTQTCPVAAFENVERKIYGVQFHPEVNHTVGGQSVLEHFLFDICGRGATGIWPATQKWL
jgi:GMP synthase (glutamine-hydrolysing)